RPHAWQRFLNRVENLGGRASFAHWDARAILLAPEWHSELREELLGFLVALGGGHERDVHALDAVDTVAVDLREHDLLLETEGVVARAVEGVRARAAEVAHTRERERHEAIHELPHALATEGHFHADGKPLAQLEVRDRLLGTRHHRLLTRDGGELLNGAVDDL